MKKVEGEQLLSMSFTPEGPGFIEASREYTRIWEAEGRVIIKAMESVSGLEFSDAAIEAVIYEGISRSGQGNSPMKLRASYSEDVKKATLVHELGHRLISQINKRPEDLDEHRVLNLILYDIWVCLYGKSFAKMMVEVERKHHGICDYEAAWQWALSLSKDERRRIFQELVANS